MNAQEYAMKQLFKLPSAAKLFPVDQPVCKADFTQQLEMSSEVAEPVKAFFRQLMFDSATIDQHGQIHLDETIGYTYSDG